MRKKIIFVVDSPYTQRDHLRFGAKYLMGKGYYVEIWRMMTENSVEFAPSGGVYQGNNYYCLDFDSFQKRLQENSKAIFIIFAIDFLQSAKFHIEIFNLKCNYIYIGGITGRFLLKGTESIKTKVKKFLYKLWFVYLQAKPTKRRHINDMTRRRYIEEYFKAWRKTPPILILTSTHHLAKQYLTKEQLKGNIMYIHTWDYDRYIEQKRKEDLRMDKYIVYCDGGFTSIDYHEALHGKLHTEILDHRKEYFDKIEILFNQMEKKYNLPVVILGHPHVIYQKGDFGGREIVYNRISEFMQKAEVLILDLSVAIGFAAMYDIPVLRVGSRFFNYDKSQLKIYLPNVYDFIKYESEVVLGCGFLDLDDEDELEHPWDFVKRIDEEKRKKYLKEYVIDGEKAEKTTYEYMEEFISSFDIK